MKAKLKVTKRLPDGTIIRCIDQIVEFVSITGKQSAKIVDNKGIERIVRRSSLMDIPDCILYPELRITIKYEPDPESWKAACYFD